MPAKRPRAFILIACACAIFWPGAFIFGLPGVLRQHWQQVFDAGGGAVGGTVFFILTGATCFMYLCGRLQEKYGPGRLTSIGAVMCGISSIWLSQAGNMIDVNIWAFSVGASSAFVYLPGLTVVQRWYPERRGLVAGFFNMAFGLSAAVMSPIFSILLSKWGYEAVTLAAGCAALTIGLAASALIRFPETDTLDAGTRCAVCAQRPLGEGSPEKPRVLVPLVHLGVRRRRRGQYAGAGHRVWPGPRPESRGCRRPAHGVQCDQRLRQVDQRIFLGRDRAIPHNGHELYRRRPCLSDHAPSGWPVAMGRSGGSHRFRLRDPVCGFWPVGRRLFRHGALRSHLRTDFYRLRFRVRAAWPMAERTYPGCHPGQLHPGFFLPGPDVSGGGRAHPAGSAVAGMSNVTP